MNRLILLSVLMMSLWASPAFAQESKKASVQERVAALLDGVESEPTSMQWTALGSAASAELITIIQNPKQKVVRRGRAVIALANFPSDASSAVVQTLLSDGRTPSLLTRKALIALARIDGDGAVDRIAPYLKNDSARIREAAVDAMAEIGTDNARAAMKKRLAVEKSESIREKLREALAAPTQLVIETIVTEPESAPPVVSKPKTEPKKLELGKSEEKVDGASTLELEL